MLFTLKIRREELREIQMLQNFPGKFCYDTISGMSIFLIFGTKRTAIDVNRKAIFVAMWNGSWS